MTPLTLIRTEAALNKFGNITFLDKTRTRALVSNAAGVVQINKGNEGDGWYSINVEWSDMSVDSFCFGPNVTGDEDENENVILWFSSHYGIETGSKPRNNDEVSENDLIVKFQEWLDDIMPVITDKAEFEASEATAAKYERHAWQGMEH